MVPRYKVRACHVSAVENGGTFGIREGKKYAISSPATNPSTILHVDHIIPWSQGGETVIDNLQTLCSDCNLGKGALLL